MNSKNYPWILVGLLWVVALLNYMDRQILATMRPAMQIDISELRGDPKSILFNEELGAVIQIRSEDAVVMVFD